MRYSILFILSFLMLSFGHIWAQDVQKKTEYTVSGTVTDEKDPFPGVFISILDKPGGGTVTNLDGKIEIKAEQGDKLFFSYVGFQKQQYVVIGVYKVLEIKLFTNSNIDV